MKTSAAARSCRSSACWPWENRLRWLALGAGLLTALPAAFAQTSVVVFSQSAYSVSESAGGLDITVLRIGDTSTAVTVNFKTTDGTAVAGSDYAATNGVLSFAVGQSNAAVRVVVFDDLLVESNETFNVELSNPTGGTSLGVTSNTVVTIIDSSTPVLQFSPTAYSVPESNTNVTITVVRTGATNTAVTVDFATGNGAAAAGSDYTATNGTLAFAEGQLTNSFIVTVLDDTVAESNETVNLLLSNPTGGAVLGSASSAVLTILDNEPPSIHFSADLYRAVEGDRFATITVVRIGSTTNAVAVDYATSAGTATAGTDYFDTSGTLNFAPGDASKTFSITLVDDRISEPNETVELFLSNLTGGAELGEPSHAVLTIVNDDGAFASFLDEDGDSVTVTLKGPGNMDLTLANGDTGPVEAIELSGTDSSSFLKIVVKPAVTGDGLLSVGEITSDGLLARIDAPACDLDGAGLDLAGESPTLRTALRFHRIADEAIVNVGADIQSLTVAEIGVTEIAAPRIRNLRVTGDKQRGIAGDLRANITLTGNPAAPGPATLASLSVAGIISDAIITVQTGSVGRVRATVMENSVLTVGYTPFDPGNPLAGGEFLTGLRLGPVHITGREAAFRNSHLIAAQVGRVNLRSLDIANAGHPFGVLAGESIIAVTVGDPRFRWRVNDADDQSLGDFHVKW
jgi:hypothetical protein